MIFFWLAGGCAVIQISWYSRTLHLFIINMALKQNNSYFGNWQHYCLHNNEGCLVAIVPNSFSDKFMYCQGPDSVLTFVFVPYPNTEMEIPPQGRWGPTHFTQPMSWLMMSWWWKEPGHHQSWNWSGGRLNINMSSYQYRKSHCGDKTILQPSYLHNGISYTGKMTSLY